MQLFLDTASIDDIERLKPLGLVQGVTTNPALLAREGGSALQQLEAIAARVEGPVSAQVTQDGAKEMIAQGRALADVAPNVIVKVPAHAAGLEAARALSDRGVDCNVTLAFDAAQAIPFATVPVAYVSLILGRVEDFGLPSGERVRSAARLLERIGSRTKLLVASLRNPAHLRVAVEGGADVVTVPPSTWDLLFANPLTATGASDFERAWTALPEPLRRAYDELADA
ncbi:MAG: transaldolase family protein [Myxococcota bacterium]|nr:transaldolase family protein [Myxococcota bacterium]